MADFEVLPIGSKRAMEEGAKFLRETARLHAPPRRAIVYRTAALRLENAVKGLTTP